MDKYPTCDAKNYGIINSNYGCCNGYKCLSEVCQTCTSCSTSCSGKSCSTSCYSYQCFCTCTSSLQNQLCYEQCSAECSDYQQLWLVDYNNDTQTQLANYLVDTKGDPHYIYIPPVYNNEESCYFDASKDNVLFSVAYTKWKLGVSFFFLAATGFFVIIYLIPYFLNGCICCCKTLGECYNVNARYPRVVENPPPPIWRRANPETELVETTTTNSTTNASFSGSSEV